MTSGVDKEGKPVYPGNANRKAKKQVSKLGNQLQQLYLSIKDSNYNYRYRNNKRELFKNI